MTKLNLINKHWLHVQCSNCRHDNNLPVLKFLDRGINDIQQIKAKPRCSYCGHRGEPEIVIYFRNLQDVEREKAPPEGEAGDVCRLGVCKPPHNETTQWVSRSSRKERK